MKLAQRALWLAVAFALCAAAQPTIGTNGIVNGASFVYLGLPNGNIAQGSIFSIFGTNLGPTAGVGAGSFPLQTTLGGVTVQITPSGGTAVNAILLYVAAGQINAILPSTVSPGTANVTVTFNSATSGAQPITVVKSSFGIFATNQAGSGQAVLNNYVSDAIQPQNGTTKPAHAGQVVILWGTGLGPVTFDEKTAPGSQGNLTASTDAMVYLGGVAIKPQYAGRTPGFGGEDQINFQIPSSMAGACQVPIAVKVNGIISNSTTISIAAEGASACSDAFTQSPSTSTGTYRIGSIGLTSSTESILGTNLTIDGATASFIAVSGSNTQQSGNGFGVTQYGACAVYTYSGTSGGSGGTGQFTYLDAGSALTLTLPDKSTKTLTKSVIQGIYTIPITVPPVSFLVPGTYTIDVPGGTGANAVGAFSASLTVPPVLTWTNMSALTGSTIDHTKGLQITWNGGDPNDGVVISGTSNTGSKVGAGFYCLAKASDQQFTIPAEVLSALPPSAVTGGISSGTLSIGDYPTLTKSNISPVPTGLDFANFIYYFWSATTVTYQ